MSPPTALSHNLLATASGRRQVKAARRAVIAQCDRCSVKATATINGFGRIAGVTVPAHRRGSRWLHGHCGGQLVAFDIEVSDG